MTCDLSFVLGRIYDAALDPALWSDALVQVCRYAVAARGTLIVEDGVATPPSLFYQSIVDPLWSQRYLETYIQLNPTRAAAAATAKTGDIILTSDFMSHDDFRATRFYSEWLQQRDLVDNAVAIVERSASRFVVLALQRDAAQGPADASMRERMAELVPHVSRALDIGKALDQALADLACFRTILDRVRSALVIVDARSRLVHANAGARRLLKEGILGCAGHGELRVCESGGGNALLAALARAGPKSRSEDAFVTVLVTADVKYLASVLPLDPAAHARFGVPAGPMTAVFLRPLGSGLALDPAALAICYGLTPRELTVMITLVETAGVPETAQILGLSTATVRTHLKSIYRKTGTNRQSELAKLAASAEPEFSAHVAAVAEPRAGVSQRMLN